DLWWVRFTLKVRGPSAVLIAVFITACGGGGGDHTDSGPPPTAISGDVSPLASPTPAAPIDSHTDVRLSPANTVPTGFPAVTQEATYTFASSRPIKISSAVFTRPKTADVFFSPA